MIIRQIAVGETREEIVIMMEEKELVVLFTVGEPKRTLLILR